MRKTLLILAFLPTFLLAATKVTLSDLETNGWEHYKGQSITITTPLVVCGTMYDSLILAPERLYVPDERAYGLADGDSTEYWRLVKYNQSKRIKLECKYPYSINLGAQVRNLTARVMGERHLQTGTQPSFKNYRPSTKLPDMGDYDLLICSANIQNFFYHVGGYATRRNTAGQHALQCYKVAAAMVCINADLYTLCELEKGSSAPEELVTKMNELARTDRFAFVRTQETDGDTISVGFIYNKEKVSPYGDLFFAYDINDPATRIYAYRFMLQGFEDIRSGERFVVSLNHLRSKRGTPLEAKHKRMVNVEYILNGIQTAYAEGIYDDPDILLVGDYNSYTQEQPLQTIVRAGYTDVLMHYDSIGYSYSYKGECGYLDRAYATPSMATQITAVHPLHWNTDYYYSAAYYSKYNFKDRVIPKTAPAKIRKVLSPAAKKNLLFRYSDHDPILIGIKLHSSEH